jgi:ArsR family transcriptional regulator
MCINESAAVSPAIAPAVAKLDALFKAFADPTRLRILNALAAGELCVCDIVDLLDLPQSNVSRHLAALRHAGLVEVVRWQQFAHYRLSAPDHPVHRTLLNCVRSCFKGIESLDDERAAAEARVTAREADPC